MHPFCCVSPISDRNNDNHHPSFSPMPSQQPPYSEVPTAARPPHSNGALLDPKHRININNNHNFNQNQSHNNNNNNHHNLNQVTAVDQREVKINDLVGNGICGILYKWVNYGKGWRPRWFVLQDGVLSYYKIHGPDKITLSSETEKGSKVIGDESMRRIQRHKNSLPQLRRKPFGEIHLKVSSIRESRSDDKRFSIFTGTKRLHLRAETREDRAAWMDALQAVKDMFPRMSNSELMAPVDNAVVSTEKLRQRLVEEGVSEAAIQDSEQIMKTEFATLQNQLVLLKQKQWLLIDTLRQLEMEGVVNFFGRISFLVDQNTQAVHFFMSALLQLFDRGGVLYGELARFVLRILGWRRKSRKVGPPGPNGLPLPAPNSPMKQALLEGPKAAPTGGAWDNVWGTDASK